MRYVTRFTSLFVGRFSSSFSQCLSFSTRAGVLWSLLRPAYFSDRFQLGGSTSVRMFRNNSMGPRDGGKTRSAFSIISFRSLFDYVVDSLGGELYWAAGLSLISDFPKKPDWPVKTHLFLNAGRMDNIDRGEFIPATLASTLLFVISIACYFSQIACFERARYHFPAISICWTGDSLPI